MSEHIQSAIWSQTAGASVHTNQGETPNAAPMPKEERRQARRARIALRMRVRSADFRDGQVEQIAQTADASRKGFYFHTMLGHYYKGMRLRIIAPYHDHARGADSEEIAEVVRVDQRSGAFGVAIVRGTAMEQPPPVAETTYVVDQTTATNEAADRGISERRSHPRSPFVATVEMSDLKTGAMSHARTADISLSGCYIDTLNPLPLGSLIDITIKKKNQSLQIQANVRMQCPGSGMGVIFDTLTAEQTLIIRTWLEQVAKNSN